MQDVLRVFSTLALKGAIVYLKDTHSLAIKSSITDDAGSYRFGQLAQNVDYEVWVVFRGRRTPIHSISKFDSHMAKVINFTMRTF